MPQQKDEIWRKFNEIILPNGCTRAEYKLCKITIVGLVVRTKSHFQDCSTRHAAVQLKRSAVDLLEVLNPITEALNLLQGEKTTISEATEIWKGLLDESA